MKKLSAIIVVSFSVLFCLFFTSCGSEDDSKAENGKEEKLIPVEVAQVEMGSVEAFFSGTATLEVEEEAGVVAKVSGVVKKILVEEGQTVQAGQVLARLDDEKLVVLVAQAEANFRKLENNYNRNQELFNRKLISAEEFQGAKFEFESQKATFDLVKLDLEYASIRAPITGVIAERFIKVGNMVLNNAVTFKITGFDPLRAVLYVPEREVAKLAVGQSSLLNIDALEGQSYPGFIERISPVVDPMTGTVKVTVSVRNTGKKLKPGMFVRVNISYDIHKNALLVPKDAILAEDTESAIFVVQDSMAFRRVVKTGYSNEFQLEIISGLELGEVIVTTGQGSLKDSAKVEIIGGKLTAQN